MCFGDAEKALGTLEERAKAIVNAGKLPLMLGGEHLVTLAPVRVLSERFPDMHIIHFDAHADLREDYLGAPAVPRVCDTQMSRYPRRRQDTPVWHTERRAL